MGNGPLLIGENIGEAKAWNPAVPVQAFTGLLMQQKAKRDAENAELANVLTQVRSDGLRNDADRQEFFNKYQQIKDAAIKNNYERDPMKRAMNKALVKDQMVQLQDYVNRSKAQGQREADFAKAYMANPTAWGDDALNPFRKSRQSALSSPETITDFTTLQRLPNVDKITKDFSGIIGNNLKQQVWQTARRSGKEGNLTGTFEANSRAIDPENVYLSANTYYDLHPDFQRLLQTSFPDVYANNPPEQAKAIAVKNYVDNGLQNGYFGPTKESQPESFRADRAPDNYYAHLAAREAAALARQGDEKLTPAQTLVTQMQQQIPGSGEKLIALAPAAQYGGKKPSINIDNTTGEHIFQFPAIQGGKDQSAVKFNNDLRTMYKLRPEKTGTWPFKTEVPFEKSEAAKQLKPEIAIKRPAQTYRLNPASPDYLAKAAEMAKEQNINLSQLNTIESKKGGRGQIDAAVKAPEKARAVKAETPKTIRVSLNGREGEIPLDKYIEFKKKYPNAQRIN